MSIFNSLGSNYSRRFILDSFSIGTKKHTLKLKKILHDIYQAETIQLTYKGREAITLILNQIDAPKDSYVAINGYTCYAVYEAVTAAGFKPYYLDIEKDELNFTPATLEEALKNEKNIKAVVIQNTLAIPADAVAIGRLCKSHKVVLIEDLAHSVGLKYSGGQEAGLVGDFSALSFSQDKMIDAISGGGAIFKNSNQTTPVRWSKVSFRERLSCRLYPSLTWLIRKTYPIKLGKPLLQAMKSLKILHRPMTGQAAVAHTLPSWYSRLAIKSFASLESLIAHRKHIAEIYRQNLPTSICLKHYDNTLYLRFPILIDNRQALIRELKKAQVHVGDIWYDAPISPKRFMDETDYKNGSCPNSEYVAERMVNLPTHINVNEEQAKVIAKKINQWLKSQPNK